LRAIAKATLARSNGNQVQSRRGQDHAHDQLTTGTKIEDGLRVATSGRGAGKGTPHAIDTMSKIGTTDEIDTMKGIDMMLETDTETILATSGRGAGQGPEITTAITTVITDAISQDMMSGMGPGVTVTTDREAGVVSGPTGTKDVTTLDGNPGDLAPAHHIVNVRRVRHRLEDHHRHGRPQQKQSLHDHPHAPLRPSTSKPSARFRNHPSFPTKKTHTAVPSVPVNPCEL
jgi:hypothetical protein